MEARGGVAGISEDDYYQDADNSYFDEEAGLWVIDAWTDPDEEDNGESVAYVNPKNYEITYLNKEAEESMLVKEKIWELIDDLKHKRRYNQKSEDEDPDYDPEYDY